MSDQDKSKLLDMNGNKLRVGDLVMVHLQRPFVMGNIVDITTPSILTKDLSMGVVTIQAMVQLTYDPRKPQILQSVAKMVDPRSEAIVEALSAHVNRDAADMKLPPAVHEVGEDKPVELPQEDKKEPEVKEPSGPVLVEDKKA